MRHLGVKGDTDMTIGPHVLIMMWLTASGGAIETQSFAGAVACNNAIKAIKASSGYDEKLILLCVPRKAGYGNIRRIPPRHVRP